MPAMSISVVKGHGSMTHNNRDFLTKNVDKERIQHNIYYVQEPIESAYQTLFGAEVERYNSTQKRADRKISDYMEHIKKSKNGEKLFYETVVQVGNKFDCHTTSENGAVVKSVLDEYMKLFQERNPNLYVFNAVLHLDEATPHLHIDYIPFATSYVKGLQVRNSLDRALKEQGVNGSSSKKENSTQNWQSREKDCIESIMGRYGLEREALKGISREHLSISQYKAVAEQIANEVKAIPIEIDSKPALMGKDKVIVDKAELEQLEHRARLVTIHIEATQQLEEKAIKSTKERAIYTSNKESDIFRLHKEATDELLKAQQERKKYSDLYQQQKGLVASYNELVKNSNILTGASKEIIEENTRLKNEVITLTGDVSTLQSRIIALQGEIEVACRKVAEPLKKQIESLKEALQGAYTVATNIVKAVSMLKYDKDEKGYAVKNLTPKQSRLIDGVADYGAKWAKEDGFEDKANDMQKTIGISDGLKKYIRPEQEISR